MRRIRGVRDGDEALTDKKLAAVLVASGTLGMALLLWAALKFHVSAT